MKELKTYYNIYIEKEKETPGYRYDVLKSILTKEEVIDFLLNNKNFREKIVIFEYDDTVESLELLDVLTYDEFLRSNEDLFIKKQINDILVYISNYTDISEKDEDLLTQYWVNSIENLNRLVWKIKEAQPKKDNLEYKTKYNELLSNLVLHIEKLKFEIKVK